MTCQGEQSQRCLFPAYLRPNCFMAAEKRRSSSTQVCCNNPTTAATVAFSTIFKQRTVLSFLPSYKRKMLSNRSFFPDSSCQEALASIAVDILRSCYSFESSIFTWVKGCNGCKHEMRVTNGNDLTKRNH